MNRADLDLAGAIDALMAADGHHTPSADFSSATMFGGLLVGLTSGVTGPSMPILGEPESIRVAAPAAPASGGGGGAGLTADDFSLLRALLLPPTATGAAPTEGGSVNAAVLATLMGGEGSTAVVGEADGAANGDSNESAAPAVDYSSLLVGGIDMDDEADRELMRLMVAPKGGKQQHTARSGGARNEMGVSEETGDSQRPVAATGAASKKFFDASNSSVAFWGQQRTGGAAATLDEGGEAVGLNADGALGDGAGPSMAYLRSLYSDAELRRLQRGGTVSVGGVVDSKEGTAERSAAQVKKTVDAGDGIDDIETDDEGIEGLEAAFGGAPQTLMAGPSIAGSSSSLAPPPSSSLGAVARAAASGGVDPMTAVLLAGLESAAFRGDQHFAAASVGAADAQQTQSEHSNDKDIGAEADAAATAAPAVAPKLNNLFVTSSAGGGASDGDAAADSDTDSDGGLAALMTTTPAVVASRPIQRGGIAAAAAGRRALPLRSEATAVASVGPVGAESQRSGQITAPQVATSQERPTAPAKTEDSTDDDDGDNGDDDEDAAAELPGVSPATTNATMLAKLGLSPESPSQQRDTAKGVFASQLRELAAEVDDAVVPMALDPSFDYDVNICGTTTLFGELVRSAEGASNASYSGEATRGGAIPEGIMRAAAAQEALLVRQRAAHALRRHAATDAPMDEATVVALGGGEARDASKFARLFLAADSAALFDAPPAAASTADGIEGGGDRQLVGGMDDEGGEDEGGDISGAEARQHGSLVGVVDERNADDAKVVDIIMQWAGQQQ